MAAPNVPQAYEKNEVALCFHGPLIYVAKVLDTDIFDAKTTKTDVTGPHYFVHYKGWKQSWDEWVPESRLVKNDAAGKARQAQLKQLQRQVASSSTSGNASAKGKENEKDKEMVAGTRASGSSSRGLNGNGEGSARGTPMPGIESGRPKGKEKERDLGAAGAGKGVSSRKRTRGEAFDTEEQYMKRPEVKIPIPDVLKMKLVDDWENVTKNNQLVTLPRTPNVKEIVEEYRSYAEGKRVKEKLTRADALIAEVLAGLLVYFDKALGNNLLYRFERAQYVDIRRKTAELKPMSEIYGAEHLLRLFVNLPSFIAHTNMDTESVNILRDHIADFLKWMIKEQDRIFQKEYETTTSQYQNASRA